jgi:hypothetical protein
VFVTALTGHNGPQRQCDISRLKALIMYFHWKKSSLPQVAQLRKLHLKLLNFFEPAGFFTKMLRFENKFQRNFSEISLQLLKSLSIKKHDNLEKSRKNKIFIISGFNGGTGMTKSRPASRL